MDFRIVDTAANARATWLVTFADQTLGTVSEYAADDYRITDAGPYCSVSAAPHRTRIGAGCALMTARRTNTAEQVDDSGLMKITRDVLAYEGTDPSDDERHIKAARLGISPVIYTQIVRALREDPRAYALNPQTVNRMRARHSAALARTARFRPQVPTALARAS